MAARGANGRFLPKGGGSGAATVTDTDHGAAERLANIAEAAQPLFLTVGVHAAEGSAEVDGAPGLTIAALAEIHEFGLGVPQRSFIGAWFDETIAQQKEDLKRMAKAVAAGKVDNMRIGLERLGLVAVSQIVAKINSNIPPALAPSTIARKGSSLALVDTGVLRSSITYKVTEEGPEE